VIFGLDVARPLAGPFVAACALLVVAGAGKVLHPRPARVAAGAAGLPASGSAVVGFGLVEVVAGGAGVVLGGPAALAVAACYLALTFVALRLLRRAPSTPCACLGSPKATVTRAHVAVDLAAAGVAIAAVPGGSPFAALSGSWPARAAFVVLVACCVQLAVLVLEALPDLSAATEEGAF
jgi:Methylamine utilisation protein MauE